MIKSAQLVYLVVDPARWGKRQALAEYAGRSQQSGVLVRFGCGWWVGTPDDHIITIWWHQVSK
jgi:hypothetical protein